MNKISSSQNQRINVLSLPIPIFLTLLSFVKVESYTEYEILCSGIQHNRRSRRMYRIWPIGFPYISVSLETGGNWKKIFQPLWVGGNVPI
jgi:hypothetical protein